MVIDLIRYFDYSQVSEYSVEASVMSFGMCGKLSGFFYAVGLVENG